MPFTALEQEVFDMYDEEGFGNLEQGVCCECRKKAVKQDSELFEVTEGPASLWFVGAEYGNDPEKKVLFVGKEMRFDKKDQKKYPSLTRDKALDKTYIDWTRAGRDLWNGTSDDKETWAFWEYTREIAKQVFGVVCDTEALEKIALTNWTKCTVPDELKNRGKNRNKKLKDRAVACSSMKRHCTHFLLEEIAVLKPTHIVMYGPISSYGKLLANMFDSTPVVCNNRKLGTKRNTEELHGTINGNDVKILIATHPQMADKEAFVSRVVDFIES